jgi:DNA-binding transcriptional ArsR family regulator
MVVVTDAASDDRGEPVGWLDSVTLQGSDTPVRAVLDGRDGNRVFVRQADPSDGDPPRVPVFEGDEIVVMTALAAVGHHLTEEVGRIDDLVTSARIVPVRREGNKVFARTLNYGELDDGDRVHVRPGDELIFEEGSVVLELEAIDAKESSCRAEDEYVPITPVLWSWLVCGGVHDEAKARYLLAAARRLDAASVLLAEVERLRGNWPRRTCRGRSLDERCSALSLRWSLLSSP